MPAMSSSSSKTQTATKAATPVVPAPTLVVHEKYAPADPVAGGRGKGFPSIFKANPKEKQYTWEEVAKHNTEKSCWVYIGNKVYDITPFLERHPGGKEILLLSAGRDISDLFVSYHPFTDRPAQVIGKYQIGEISSTEFPQFVPDRGFYTECRQAVGEYFRSNKLDHKDPRPGVIRLAGFLTTFFACWYLLAQGSAYGWPLRIAAALVLGVAQALPLLHTMHDSSHLAIGSTPAWWRFMGRLCMDWLCGASVYSWYNQHTIGHHVYTNVQGADPDVPVKLEGDIRRITPFQKSAAFYRWQHVYLMVLYGALAIKFRIQDITDTIMDQTNGAIRVNAQSSWDLGMQAFTKTFWVVWRILVPLYYFGCDATSFWSTWLLAELVTGYFLAFNFQVSHVSPAAIWPDVHFPMSDEWAVNQLHTSIDYAHGNKVVQLFAGALNYQSVHHLFPSISQYHYPAIAPIVQRICAKHGVRYNYLPTFWQAFTAHIQHLKNMGEQGIELEHAHMH